MPDVMHRSDIAPAGKRRWLVLAALVLALAPASGCTQPEAAADALARGNEHYEQGDYRGALAAYREALEAGYASGALYVNLGDAYYRLGELGHAVRFYERARRYRPEDPVLAHNLQIVRERLPGRFVPAPRPAWQRWWDRVAAWGAGTFFWPGLLFYSLGLVLLAHRIWTRTREPWHRRGLVASLAVGLVLIALAYGVSLNAGMDQRAAIVAQEAAVRQQPLEGAQPETFAPEGAVVDVLDTVDVLGTDDGWLRVRLPDGVTGWVAREATAAI